MSAGKAQMEKIAQATAALDGMHLLSTLLRPLLRNLVVAFTTKPTHSLSIFLYLNELLARRML